MQNLKIFQIDTFTDKLFSGNPAAVCILEQWLPEDFMEENTEKTIELSLKLI